MHNMGSRQNLIDLNDELNPHKLSVIVKLMLNQFNNAYNI